MAIARRAGDPAHIASTQRGLARLLLDSDPGRAATLLRESLATLVRARRRQRDRRPASRPPRRCAEPPTGALLWGAAGALRAEAGATRQPDEVAFAARVEAALRDALGPEAFAAAVAEGAALPQAEAVALAYRNLKGTVPFRFPWAMEFSILGPLRVVGPDGPIEIKAPKQRSLLAMLLLSHRLDVVSAERLIDALWGEHPPPTATKALQVNVSQLRRALGADAIVTRPGGYAMRARARAAGPRALRDARRARPRHGVPRAQAADLLREALALFRGPPLADAPLLGPGVAEADRIESARLDALELRLEHDLALGRHTSVATELEGLAAEHAYRERLHAQFMLALYRCGRQADALEAYRRARHALVEDLGLDPSPELKRLEAAILAQDPALELERSRRRRPRTRPAGSRSRAPPLPIPATPLLGREDGPRHRRRAARRPARPPAHAHRPRRDRQDPPRARARAPARARLRRRRPLRRARGARGPGARRLGDRAGARRERGRGPRRGAGPQRAAARDRQLRAAAGRRPGARPPALDVAALEARWSPAAPRCGSPASTSSRCRRSRSRPSAELFVGRARALDSRLTPDPATKPGSSRSARASTACRWRSSSPPRG